MMHGTFASDIIPALFGECFHLDATCQMIEGMKIISTQLISPLFKSCRPLFQRSTNAIFR